MQFRMIRRYTRSLLTPGDLAIKYSQPICKIGVFESAGISGIQKQARITSLERRWLPSLFRRHRLGTLLRDEATNVRYNYGRACKNHFSVRMLWLMNSRVQWNPNRSGGTDQVWGGIFLPTPLVVSPTKPLHLERGSSIVEIWSGLFGSIPNPCLSVVTKNRLLSNLSLSAYLDENKPCQDIFELARTGAATPADLGYYFPQSFAPPGIHVAQLPHKEESWPGNRRDVFMAPYCLFHQEVAKAKKSISMSANEQWKLFGASCTWMTAR